MPIGSTDPRRQINKTTRSLPRKLKVLPNFAFPHASVRYLFWLESDLRRLPVFRAPYSFSILFAVVALGEHAVYLSGEAP